MKLTSQEKMILWKQTKEKMLGKGRRAGLAKESVKRAYRDNLDKISKSAAEGK